MNLKPLTPKQCLNKAYLKEKISRTDIELFKASFADLLSKINDKGDEEHLKSLISDFLKLTWYNRSQNQNIYQILFVSCATATKRVRQQRVTVFIDSLLLCYIAS